MTTTSTMHVWRQLRTAILAYTPSDGRGTLQSRLGGRFYWNHPPDDPTYRYAVGRFINRLGGQAGNAERETWDVEVQIAGRGDAAQEAVEDDADILDLAMTNYAAAASGLVFSRTRQRDTLPRPTAPADADVVAVRCVYPVVVWPAYLLATASSP